jgi:hypothetical protein
VGNFLTPLSQKLHLLPKKRNQLSQTNSKPRIAPTSNLTLTIFRFQNTSNFYTPRYIWSTLSSISIPPSSISQSFTVLHVPVNASVAAGDKLGLVIISETVTPLCVLVRNVTQLEGDRNLFANRAGQVSLRGREGDRAPVVVWEGGEVKWEAVVG